MMSGTHPDELQLLDYVEGELDDAARDVLDAHLAGCAECAAQITRLEAGREALRGAPLLEAPERIRPELPERVRARPSLRPRRLVALLAPVAVVAGVVAIVATTNPGGDDEAKEASRAAPTMAAEAEEGGAESAPAQALDAAVVRSVAGPPNEVVRLLQQEGLEARRADDRVEVSGATPEQVEVALADRPDGPVQVIAVP